MHSLLKLARLEGPHMDHGDIAEPEALEEGQEVVSDGPLVAVVGARGYLVAGRVRKPALQVFGDGKALRIGEEHTLALVGKRDELCIVRLLSGTAVEAYLPASGRRVESGAGLVAPVCALARVGARPVGILAILRHAPQGSTRATVARSVTGVSACDYEARICRIGVFYGLRLGEGFANFAKTEF